LVKDTIPRQKGGSVSLYKRGGIWWIYLTHKGKRIRESAETEDRRKAQEYHDKLKAELWDRKEHGATLADALTIWLKHKERSESDRSAIRVLLRHYPSRPISKVTQHGIVDALGSRKAETKNKTLAIVRAALNLAHERGLCDKQKFKRLEADGKRLRFLTQEEWQRLYECLPIHQQPICLFAVLTGLRLSNVLSLRWQAVSIENSLVWVDSVDAKGGKNISVPLSLEAVEILKAQTRYKHGYVFTYKGKPTASIKKGFNYAVEKAGLEDVTFHTLRHTWASWHVQKGTPLAVLKELGGWADMDMVMRYAHLSPTHLRQWV
jgi:integrase